MDDPPRIHADPSALARLREMQRERPAGDTSSNERVARAFAGLVESLGSGDVDAVLASVASEGWREGIDPTSLDAERYAFTRGLCEEAARALDRPDPLVMSAGIALYQSMVLWLGRREPPGRPGGPD
ncbi:MAG: hypothetical protein KY453_10380 [Gemmatimonadetes bacterium]|nr:hypothetical protein [Gemmatimonadota bacterium]